MQLPCALSSIAFSLVWSFDLCLVSRCIEFGGLADSVQRWAAWHSSRSEDFHRECSSIPVLDGTVSSCGSTFASNLSTGKFSYCYYKYCLKDLQSSSEIPLMWAFSVLKFIGRHPIYEEGNTCFRMCYKLGNHELILPDESVSSNLPCHKIGTKNREIPFKWLVLHIF